MIFLGVPFAFWGFDCLFKIPSVFESESQKTWGKIKLFGPLCNALCFAIKLKQHMSRLRYLVAESWFYIKCVLNAPPAPKSCGNGTLGYSALTGPQRYVLRLAVKGDIHVSGYVGLLFTACGPSAVFFEVTKTSIYSVYCASSRAFSHVLKEIRERLSPLWAHGYSNCPVLPILSACWPMASCNHVLVRAICSTLRYMRCVPVLGKSIFRGATLTAKIGLPIGSAIFLAHKHRAALFACYFNKVWHTFNHVGNRLSIATVAIFGSGFCFFAKICLGE